MLSDHRPDTMSIPFGKQVSGDWAYAPEEGGREEGEGRADGFWVGFVRLLVVVVVAVVVALALDRSGSRIPRGLGGISLPGSWLISHS